MSNYLPIIISAVLIIAILLWWLLALDGVKKTDAAIVSASPRPSRKRRQSMFERIATPAITIAPHSQITGPGRRRSRTAAHSGRNRQ